MSNSNKEGSILTEFGEVMEQVMFFQMLEELRTTFEIGKHLLQLTRERGEAAVTLDREKIKDGLLAVVDAISMLGTAVSSEMLANVKVSDIREDQLEQLGMDRNNVDPGEALRIAAERGRKDMFNALERAYRGEETAA